jgi:UrcA family protein
MTTSTNAIHPNALRRGLPIAFAIGALAIMSASAHAEDDLDQITISTPAVKTLGYDFGIGAPIHETSVTANVKVDPAGLTTRSGVTLLKESVLDAARRACNAADPITPDDGTCVHDAVKTATPQVNAAIARARSTANG